MTTQETVLFTLPGEAYRAACEGTQREDVAEALANARITRRGRGSQATLAVPRSVAEELADYFWSVSEAVGGMTGAEREGGREHIASQIGVARIEAALRRC